MLNDLRQDIVGDHNKKLQKKSGDHKTAFTILAMVCLLEAGSSP